MQAITVNTKSEQEWLEARVKDITSTEVSALFGISPYCTEFELWHRKKDEVVLDFEPSNRMKWGTRLQDSIAAGIAEDEKWTVSRMDEYMRIPELRIGASFDFSIDGNPQVNAFLEKAGLDPDLAVEKGLLEIKNVDGLIFRNEWIEDDNRNLEAPLHIEIQVQHQLAVCGRSYAYIGALVGGNNVVLLRRARNEKIIAAIKSRVAKFWQSIDENKPPKPNFEMDASFLCDLYVDSEPGKIIDVTANEQIFELAKTYKEAADMETDAKTSKKACKAQILTMIGDCNKALGNGFNISAGTVGEAYIESHTRKAYRGFRVTWKKQT